MLVLSKIFLFITVSDNTWYAQSWAYDDLSLMKTSGTQKIEFQWIWKYPLVFQHSLKSNDNVSPNSIGRDSKSIYHWQNGSLYMIFEYIHTTWICKVHVKKLFHFWLIPVITLEWVYDCLLSCWISSGQKHTSVRFLWFHEKHQFESVALNILTVSWCNDNGRRLATAHDWVQFNWKWSQHQ